MGTLLVAEEPVSAGTIDKLVGQFHRTPAMHIVSSLGCVLTWAPDAPVRIIHPSLRGYLCSDHHRDDRPWFIDVARHRRILGSSCLQLAVQHLAGNHDVIATLDLDPCARGVDAEVKETFAAEIQHAYKFWIEYLCTGPQDDGVLQSIAKDIAIALDPGIFWDWCIVVDTLWTRFKVLELTYKLLAWTMEHLSQLSLLEPRISKDAIRKVLEAIFKFLETPSPGRLDVALDSSSSRPASTYGSTVTIAPPQSTPESIHIVGTGESDLATSGPSIVAIQWHQTVPYKLLKEMERQLNRFPNYHTVSRYLVQMVDLAWSSWQAL